MAGPANARTTSRGRLYRHPLSGEEFWSVTTIIGNGVPKPALVPWAAKSVAEFAVANHRQLSGMLGTVRLHRANDGILLGTVKDPDSIEAAIDWLKGAPWRERERAARLGTEIHAEIDAFVLGTPRPEPDPMLRPFIEQFRLFLDAFHPEFEASEITVWNRTQKFAGTLDWIARIGNRLILGDNKTGSGVYPDAALQLSAYRFAEFMVVGGEEQPMPEVDGCAILHLRPDSWQLIPVHTDRKIFEAFLYAREVMRWSEETSKSVLGAPLQGPDGVDWTFPVAEAA